MAVNLCCFYLDLVVKKTWEKILNLFIIELASVFEIINFFYLSYSPYFISSFFSFPYAKNNYYLI